MIVGLSYYLEATDKQWFQLFHLVGMLDKPVGYRMHDRFIIFQVAMDTFLE